MRDQALEIEREGVVSLDRSDRLKAALVARTTELDKLVPRTVGDTPAQLATNASAAASAIDANATFVFQRGVIQEAMRRRYVARRECVGHSRIDGGFALV